MALDEAELKVVIRAVGTDLLRGMEEARASVERATGQMRGDFQKTETSVTTSMAAMHDRVTTGVAGIQASIRTFARLTEISLAILGLEGAIAHIIGESQEWAEGQDHLQKALNLSANETAVLAVAAKEAGTPIAELDGLIRGLALHLNANEGELRNVGLATRDAHGNFLPLFDLLRNGLKTIDEYRAGTDQLIIAQRIFGRGATEQSIDGLRKTIENLERAKVIAQEFGLVVGHDGVIAAQAFTRAQADLSLAALGVKNVLADTLRPEIE
jgi:hypothetical protein